jgi:hypothetical protein
MGRVKFWDADTATQFASFPAHQADVLCLAVGSVSLFIFIDVDRALMTPTSMEIPYSPLVWIKKSLNLP